jgi:glycosyltransferase involved in cell wall biosynthesis
MISVIVPVYNTEKYLDRCIQSILAQTYTDFELLLIDDGSTDSSGAICDKYAEQDSRVRVFHKENGGVTSARKLGVLESCGEYIFLLDADDYIYKNSLVNLLTNMKEEYDLVISNCMKKETFESDEYLRILLLDNKYKAPWGKLYRTSLLKDNYVFETSRYFKVGEDFLMQLRMMKNMNKKVHCITSDDYYYRDNNESISNTFIPTLEYEIEMIKEVGRILKSLPTRYNIEKCYLDFRLMWISGMIGLQYKINYEDNWVEEIIEDSKKQELNFRQKMIVKAISIPIYRNLFIAV